MQTIHLLIQGRVQGVFFRATAKDIAISLSLNGWVKNTRDGNVEILVCGKPVQLEKFIEWCRQGPPQAKVLNVIVEPLPEAEIPQGFIILR